MAEKINGRVAYADLLRSLAIIGAILHRLALSGLESAAAGGQAWQVFNLYAGLTRWCFPVFLMLSGMFLLDKRALPLSKLFFHNLLRLLVALLVWGGIYAVVGYVTSGGRFTWWGLWQAILDALRGNTHSHLWPIYIFMGLYLVTPILRAFCRGASRGDLHYFLLLCFLLASLFPLAFRLWPGSTAVLKVWYDRLEVQLVMGYVGYFVAGHYLREYLISRLAEALIYVLGILGAMVTVWGTAILSIGGTSQSLYGYLTPNVVCFSVAIVVLFRYVLGVSEERSRRQRLSGVARVAFGIYLVHEFFFMLLRFLHISVFSLTPVASVPLLTAVVFLLSFALAWLISKIPFLGHFLT